MIGSIPRGRYAIIQRLSSGGFGETYVAEDLDLPGRPRCVAKRLQPLSGDPVVLQTARQRTVQWQSCGMTSSIAIGTPGYIPGEQAIGKPRFSSDIYALGMTAIQALMGVIPSQLQEDPIAGEVVWRSLAKVSDATADVIDKMVRSHFRDRYQAVRELIDDLDARQAKVNPPRSPFKMPPKILVIAAGASIIFIGAGVTLARLFLSFTPPSPATSEPQVTSAPGPIAPTPAPNPTPENPNATAQPAELDKWLGNYTFGEAAPPPKFGSTQTMSYKIEIAKRGNSYIANIDRDGFQTLERLSAEVRFTGSDRIGFYFTDYRPDNVREIYKPGELLLQLEKLPNNSYKVIWAGMLGLLQQSEFVPTDLVFAAQKP
jgi:serine/threonine protein kinase